MPQLATPRLFSLIVATGAALALPAAARAQETQRSADTAAMDTTAARQDTTAAQRDTAGTDTTRWGYESDTTPGVQNPPGYRGMERPTNVFPPDSGKDTTGAAEGQTRDTTAGKQNAAADTSAGTGGDTASVENRGGGDTTRVGDTTPKVPTDSIRRLPAARGDTTGQSGGTGADTTSR